MKLEQFRDLDIGTPQTEILFKRFANVFVRCCEIIFIRPNRLKKRGTDDEACVGFFGVACLRFESEVASRQIDTKYQTLIKPSSHKDATPPTYEL
jgi:hypothetical protein